MTSAMIAARERLELYVTQLVTNPAQRLDILKLKSLEDELIATTRREQPEDRPF